MFEEEGESISTLSLPGIFCLLKGYKTTHIPETLYSSIMCWKKPFHLLPSIRFMENKTMFADKGVTFIYIHKFTCRHALGKEKSKMTAKVNTNRKNKILRVRITCLSLNLVFGNCQVSF
jgi:hypothetical protein